MTRSGPLDPALGTVCRIDDRTVIIFGQELNIAADQPDVANVVLHRVGSTLFMVDTGATVEFRAALTAAVDLVGPWNRLTVLISHGHPDHVGNNDIADELARQRGIQAEVLVPVADLAQMRDPQAYWKASFDRLAGMGPLPVAPGLAAAKITSLFQPYHPFSQSCRTYEQAAPEWVSIGSGELIGWNFADGAVSVLPSQGHCAGHVVVYFRDAQLLHLGDEVNGPCPVMHDADQHKLTEIQGVALGLIADGVVSCVTDGHTFAVQDAASAAARIRRLREDGLALQRTATDLVKGRPSIDGADFAAGITRCYDDLAVKGANPNATFLAMMAAEQLQRLGYARHHLGARWEAPHLTNPAIPARSGVRLIQGAAATVPWILRGFNRSRPH